LTRLCWKGAHDVVVRKGDEARVKPAAQGSGTAQATGVLTVDVLLAVPMMPWCANGMWLGSNLQKHQEEKHMTHAVLPPVGHAYETVVRSGGVTRVNPAAETVTQNMPQVFDCLTSASLQLSVPMMPWCAKGMWLGSNLQQRERHSTCNRRRPFGFLPAGCPRRHGAQRGCGPLRLRSTLQYKEDITNIGQRNMRVP
jgi:hypothetical protein